MDNLYRCAISKSNNNHYQKVSMPILTITFWGSYAGAFNYIAKYIDAENGYHTIYEQTREKLCLGAKNLTITQSTLC